MGNPNQEAEKCHSGNSILYFIIEFEICTCDPRFQYQVLKSNEKRIEKLIFLGHANDLKEFQAFWELDFHILNRAVPKTKQEQELI